jgi:DNA-binding NarL/FixJ family response regulator
MIRIALVEDHVMLSEGLKLMLEQTGEFEVVCQHQAASTFEELCDPEKIDVVLLDLWLMGQSSATICQGLRQKYPDIRIIVLSSLDDPELILEMIRYGARAFISKKREFDYVAHTIRMVMKNGHYFDQDLGEMMNMQMQKTYKKCFTENQFGVKFNKTEMNIAYLASAGFTSIEIADKLNMSKRNVESYRANMQQKAGSSNFQGVIVYMFKHYLLLPEQF